MIRSKSSKPKTNKVSKAKNVQQLMMIPAIASIAVALSCGAAQVHAAMLVDIYIPNYGTNPAPIGAGATGSPTDIWNKLKLTAPGTKTGLLDVTGAATGLGFTLNGFNNSRTYAGPTKTNVPNPTLYNGYTFELLTNTASSIYSEVITGLTVGDSYNVYLYLQDRSASFHVIGATTPSDLTLTNAQYNTTSWIAGTNYVEYTGIAPDSSGKITIEPYSNTATGTGTSEIDLGAVQVQAAPVIPEPATLGMMAGVGVGLLLLVNRRRV